MLDAYFLEAGCIGYRKNQDAIELHANGTRLFRAATDDLYEVVLILLELELDNPVSQKITAGLYYEDNCPQCPTFEALIFDSEDKNYLRKAHLLFNKLLEEKGLKEVGKFVLVEVTF